MGLFFDKTDPYFDLDFGAIFSAKLLHHGAGVTIYHLQCAEIFGWETGSAHFNDFKKLVWPFRPRHQ